MSPRRARLGRYALWQARDWVGARGIPTLIVGALLLLLEMEAVGAFRGAAGASPPAALRALDDLLDAFLPAAVLIAVNGIISHDRARHYARFLFAKPLSPARYYLQAFAVYGALTVAATALLVAAFGALVAAVPAGGALGFAALYFLLFGGVGFLLSAITRYDWVALGVVWALARLLRTFVPASGSWYGRVLDLALPPLHVLAATGRALVHGEPAPLAACAWVAGYGLAAVVLGVVVIRNRPLAS